MQANNLLFIVLQYNSITVLLSNYDHRAWLIAGYSINRNESIDVTDGIPASSEQQPVAIKLAP